MDSEKIFYSHDNVEVTKSKFTVASKVYAMRNISSVDNQRLPANKFLAFIMVLLGIICLIVGSGSAYILGATLLGLGIYLIVTTKDKFAVKIATNSGEQEAIISEDSEYIQQIVNAINEAIVHRG